MTEGSNQPVLAPAVGPPQRFGDDHIYLELLPFLGPRVTNVELTDKIG